MKLLKTEKKNNVLKTMVELLDRNREEIIRANKIDIKCFEKDDQAMLDRLIVNDAKVDGMIKAVTEIIDKQDPIDEVISEVNREDGLKIVNKTAPFGTIMIIYESRPDVTIEAAVLAFKANNKIILKGGKEAKRTNLFLVDLWHKALLFNGLGIDWIEYLNMPRAQVQAFLKAPDRPIDLIVPRGGERLINFVKEHATCPVLVSGRGNNFLFVDENADWEKAKQVIINAKTDKISACNALDKVLFHQGLPDLGVKIKELNRELSSHHVDLLADKKINEMVDSSESIKSEDIWYEEFLDLKLAMGVTENLNEAIDKINEFSGGHSSSIITESKEAAGLFMEQVDSGAVYHNASTRFTDGGEMGVGAELAISTDKLHHRGPLGLNQLVTNKYYVFGDGHIRA